MKRIQACIPDGGSAARLPLEPADLHRALDRTVWGLESAKRVISTRLALHLQRALELARGGPSLERNQCLLVMGPSGAGKTFLIEQAAALARIPFVSASAAGLTSEGFAGQSLSGVLQMLKDKAQGRKSARYGICFLDEWDKRVQPGQEKAGFSQGVQAEALRMMEGTEVELEGHPGSGRPPGRFDTRGLMFVFAGAFTELERRLSARPDTPITGFHPGGSTVPRAVRDHQLRDALVDYGLLPEFLNRLSAILTLPAPTRDDMLALLAFGNGPLALCNRRLRAVGLELLLDRRTARDMADYACATRSYCRGLHLILQAASDCLIYAGARGRIALEPGDLQRLLDGKWPTIRETAGAVTAGPVRRPTRIMSVA